jgi:hypothetical protein
LQLSKRLASLSLLLILRLCDAPSLRLATATQSPPSTAKDAVMMLWSILSVAHAVQRLNLTGANLPRVRMWFPPSQRAEKNKGNPSIWPLNQPRLTRKMTVRYLTPAAVLTDGGAEVGPDSNIRGLVTRRLLASLGVPFQTSEDQFSHTRFSLSLSALGPEEFVVLLSVLSGISSSCLSEGMVLCLRDRARFLLPDLNEGLLLSTLNYFTRLMQSGAISVNPDPLSSAVQGKERRRWARFLEDVEVELAWRQSCLDEKDCSGLEACTIARDRIVRLVQR